MNDEDSRREDRGQGAGGSSSNAEVSRFTFYVSCSATQYIRSLLFLVRKAQNPEPRAQSRPTLDFLFFSQLVLLLGVVFCWLGKALAQDDIPVPPLEEGALLIFHPFVVHFAIALTSFGMILDWCGSVRAQPVWQQAGKICFFAGVVALGAATLSGWIEHELPRPASVFDEQARQVFFYHEYGGYILTGFFLVLAIFRISMSAALPLFFILLSGVGLIGLLIQGYLGGELVYRYGAGVRAVQILSVQDRQSRQKKAPEQSSEAPRANE